LAVLALLSLAPEAMPSQSSWAEYRPGSLAAIITRETAAALASTHGIPAATIISGERLALRAELVHTGETRPITHGHWQVLHEWAGSMGLRVSVDSLFQKECLFREGDLAIWLPVQEAVRQVLAKRSKIGDTVTAFVGYLGAQRRGTTFDWVFVVNDYDDLRRR